MKKALIEDKIRSEYMAEVERLMAAIFAELDAPSPQGIRCYAQKEEEGLRFIHGYMTNVNVKNPVVELACFKRLRPFVGHNHSEKPIRIELTEMGLYDSPE